LALRPHRSQSRAEQLAKRDAAEQGVLMREVDEALRKDEMADLFRRWGLPIAAAVIVVLLALGGYLWWSNSRKAEAGASGEQFTLALDKLDANNLPAADKQLAAVVAKGDAGSVAAARILQGGIALRQGKPDEAGKLFAAVAADAKAPQPFRELATVREVAARFDKMPPQDVVARLKPFAVPGNPWFGPAGELVAGAYLKQGRNDLAGPLFAAIARDKDTPVSLQRRARQMAGLLGVDAIDDAEQVVAGNAPAPASAPAAQ
jgi:hypothetical protein